MKKIAIVTGASSGMGKDFVLELMRDPVIDEIWMIARRKERLDAMKSKNPEKLRVVSLDLTKSESFHELEKILFKEKPEIVYLVNAAGAGRMGKVEEILMEDHGFLVDLNVRSLTCMTKICLKYMHKGSRILQICSSSAFVPQPGFATYAASKAYVLSFSRALGQELKKKKITVTAVCPGPVNTEFFQAAGKEILPAKKRFMTESKDVVKKALKDSKAGKSISVYGIGMKSLYMISKFVPVRMLLWLQERILH